MKKKGNMYQISNLKSIKVTTIGNIITMQIVNELYTIKTPTYPINYAGLNAMSHKFHNNATRLA